MLKQMGTPLEAIEIFSALWDIQLPHNSWLWSSNFLLSSLMMQHFLFDAKRFLSVVFNLLMNFGLATSFTMYRKKCGLFCFSTLLLPARCPLLNAWLSLSEVYQNFWTHHLVFFWSRQMCTHFSLIRSKSNLMIDFWSTSHLLPVPWWSTFSFVRRFVTFLAVGTNQQ